MELTIAPQSYQPDGQALTRAIYSAAAVLARCAAQEQDILGVSGVTAYICPTRPSIRAINFVSAVDQPAVNSASASSIIQTIDQHFKEQNGGCHVLYPQAVDLPESIATHAIAAGYQAVHRKVFLLTGYRRPTSINENVQIVPARAIYQQLPAFYEHVAVVEHSEDAKRSNAFAKDFATTMIDFLDEPRLELLIARVDQKNVAAAGVLSLGQIGVIIPAWSDPQHRGQGIAKTLMTHVLELCARSLFAQIIIDRSEHCTAIPFYESLGFVQAASFVKYRRRPSNNQQQAAHHDPC